MIIRSSLWCLACVVGLACGGDGPGDASGGSGGDCSNSLCGCDGCGEGDAGAESEGGTTGGETTTTTSTTTDTGTGEATGTMEVCTCDPADPVWVECPDEASCTDDGAECCTLEGTVKVCTQNDIGIIWLNQYEC